MLSEESVTTFKELEYRAGLAESLINLARVKAYQGNVVAARAQYGESWALVEEGGDKELNAACLEGMGGGVVVQWGPRWGTQRWGEPATPRAAKGAAMPAADPAPY